MLDGVALAMGVVIHRIDAPLVTGTVVGGMLDAVQQRIPEHHIRMSHINLGPQHLFAIGILTRLHFPEKTKVLLDAPVPVRALDTRLVHGTAMQADLLLRLIVDIGQPSLDQLLSPFI